MFNYIQHKVNTSYEQYKWMGKQYMDFGFVSQ